MHNNIDKIKKLEGSVKILKNLFSKTDLEKFLNLYHNLPTTVHNKKQNVIKKRWLKNYSEELENIFMHIYSPIFIKVPLFLAPLYDK